MRFGTGGIPHSCENCSVIQGVEHIHNLGLNAMEIEFVYGIYNLPDSLNSIAEKYDVGLSIHGSYFVNLAAKDNKKFYGSISTVVKTLEVAHNHSIPDVVFHPAFYLKRNPGDVYDLVKKALVKIQEELESRSINDVTLRLELMGKPTQFGTPGELISLSQEFDFVLPCIDFAHFVARYNGMRNTEDGFKELLADLEQGLGNRLLKNMHIHLSNIEYSEKGEKKHLNLTNDEREGVLWQTVLRLLKEFGADGKIISETPSLEVDAIKMRDYWNSL